MAEPTDFETLLALADAADRETLPLFRTVLGVDNKRPADFDPVTEADRAAERAIREAIEARFPAHAILGEEYGSTGTGDSRWVIDPVDGTRAFIAGVPVWGTLIGYCEAGRAVAGIMSQPFTGERFLAGPEGAELRRGETRTRLKVRQTKRLQDAVMFTTTPRLYQGQALERFETLEATARLTRFGVDCYAFAMLAAGHADLVVETGLQPYDIVALIPIVEAAGGTITTWQGSRAEGGGNVVAAATPELHAAALEILNG